VGKGLRGEAKHRQNKPWTGTTKKINEKTIGRGGTLGNCYPFPGGRLCDKEGSGVWSDTKVKRNHWGRDGRGKFIRIGGGQNETGEKGYERDRISSWGRTRLDLSRRPRGNNVLGQEGTDFRNRLQQSQGNPAGIQREQKEKKNHRNATKGPGGDSGVNPTEKKPTFPLERRPGPMKSRERGQKTAKSWWGEEKGDGK